MISPRKATGLPSHYLDSLKQKTKTTKKTSLCIPIMTNVLFCNTLILDLGRDLNKTRQGWLFTFDKKRKKKELKLPWISDSKCVVISNVCLWKGLATLLHNYSNNCSKCAHFLNTRGTNETFYIAEGNSELVKPREKKF